MKLLETTFSWAMFDKLRQMQDLFKLLQEQEIAVEQEGVRLVLDGSFDLKEISLNPELSIERQEAVLKELWAEARKKVQSALMRRAGGFGL